MRQPVFLLLVFTLAGFAVMGYHPGLEDDGIYLTAVKARLDPALYPHNSGFFRMQMQATAFDRAMAGFVRATHIPVAWAELLWQLACLFGILRACHGIAGALFKEERAQWAGVAMVAAMLTLPVTGTALYLADQHLHPRNAATALILLAVWQILVRRRWMAVPLLAAACLLHPLMAMMGASFCCFLAATLLTAAQSERQAGEWSGEAAALGPVGWLLGPATDDWRQALAMHRYYRLYEWTWYEWLGALGPLALFSILWRVAERRGETLLARFSLAVLAYGVFQQCVAMTMLTPPGWVRLTSLQPMRYLHLVYFAMVLVGGCLAGKHLLRASVWRWAVYLAVINGGMLAWQMAAYPGSAHLEMPWLHMPSTRPANPWLEAFAWVRANTPKDAYFALDPYYLRAPDEDYHSFTALAERSQLADAIKDSSVAVQIPALAPAWADQVGAEQGWERFGRADFERLKAEFGVDWVLAPPAQAAGLDCRWHNQALAACEIP